MVCPTDLTTPKAIYVAKDVFFSDPQISTALWFTLVESEANFQREIPLQSNLKNFMLQYKFKEGKKARVKDFLGWYFLMSAYEKPMKWGLPYYC